MTAECRHLTATITEVLNSEEGAKEFRALMEANASGTTLAAAFAAHCSPMDSALMMREFAELPRSFVGTFMDAWLMAVDGGKRFALASRPPAMPLDYARRDCVSFNIEHDRNGVTVFVSHIHGRHAEWYRPAATAVS